MALFARRVIQRCLDANASFASRKTLHDWVKRLNKVSKDYVATEWEVALLSTFAGFGCIQHEPALGARPIDLVFEAPDGGLKFGADIAAISDETLHERNPIRRFRDEFNRRVLKAGIRGGRFVFRVGDQPSSHRGTGRKPKLLLPPANQFDAIIFTAAFDDYILAIQKEPLVPRDHYVGHQSPDVYVSIQYQPGRGWGAASLSYTSYTSTTVIDHNPLFNALKSKADQLRRSGYEGIRGIIVCDGGSRMFTEISTWASYTMDEVVREFFRQNTSVLFVATIGIKSRPSGVGAGVSLYPDPRLFVNGSVEQLEWSADLNRLLHRVTAALPALEQTPENVRISMDWNRSTKRTKPYYGGSEMTRNEIRMSSRELLDLLAGKLDHELFAKRYDLGGGNLFGLFRDRGRMISSAAIERRPDEDDDWIVLRFSDGDPATCDFVVPETGPSSA